MSTAEWCVQQLLQMDWCTRHAHLKLLQRSRPKIYKEVTEQLSPCQAIAGLNTGVSMVTPAAIIVKDKCRKGKQLKLDSFFRKKD